MSENIIEFDGTDYVPLSVAIDRIRHLAVMSSGAAVVAAIAAISQFIDDEVVTNHRITITQLVGFLADRAEDYEFISEFAESAVKETLEGLVTLGVISEPEDE